jgi:hypothetical protein
VYDPSAASHPAPAPANATLDGPAARRRSSFPTPPPAAGRAAVSSPDVASSAVRPSGAPATIIVQEEDSSDDASDAPIVSQVQPAPSVTLVDDVIEVTQPGLARRFEDSRRRLLLAGAAIAVAAFATAFWVGRLRSAPESADATPAQTEKALHPEPPPSEPPVADPEPEQELEAAPLDPTSLPVAAEEAEPIEVEEPPKPVQRAAKSAPQKRKPGLSAITFSSCSLLLTSSCSSLSIISSCSSSLSSIPTSSLSLVSTFISSSNCSRSTTSEISCKTLSTTVLWVFE